MVPTNQRKPYHVARLVKQIMGSYELTSQCIGRTEKLFCIHILQSQTGSQIIETGQNRKTASKATVSHNFSSGKGTDLVIKLLVYHISKSCRMALCFWTLGHPTKVPFFHLVSSLSFFFWKIKNCSNWFVNFITRQLLDLAPKMSLTVQTWVTIIFRVGLWILSWFYFMVYVWFCCHFWGFPVSGNYKKTQFWRLDMGWNHKTSQMQ